MLSGSKSSVSTAWLFTLDHLAHHVKAVILSYQLWIRVLNKAYSTGPDHFLLPLFFNEATNSVESGDLNSNHFPFAL